MTIERNNKILTDRLKKDYDSTHTTVATNSAHWVGGGGGGVISITNTALASGAIVFNGAGVSQAGNIFTFEGGDMTDISTASGGWNSTQSTVNSNSGIWTNVWNQVNSLSDGWTLSGTEVDLGDIPALSANWNSVYSNVNVNSAKWESTYATVCATSGYMVFNELTNRLEFANPSGVSILGAFVQNGAPPINIGTLWYDETAIDPTIPTFNSSEIAAASGGWNSTYTTVNTNSAGWESTESIMNSSSANWNSTYFTLSSYVPYTGATGNVNLGALYSINGTSLYTNPHDLGPLISRTSNMGHAWIRGTANNGILINGADSGDYLNSRPAWFRGGHGSPLNNANSDGSDVTLAGGNGAVSGSNGQGTGKAGNVHIIVGRGAMGSPDGNVYVSNLTANGFVKTMDLTGKLYIDTSEYLNITGGIMTGSLSAGGNLDMRGFSIVNVASSSIVFEDGNIFNTTKINNWDSTYTAVSTLSASWAGGGSDISALTGNWESTHTTVESNSGNWNTYSSKKATLGCTFNGMGSALQSGLKTYLTIPYDCMIQKWYLIADTTGNLVIDVWKDTWANFPPTVADSIAGSEKPTLVASQINRDVDLTTWSVNISSGDVMAFKVNSCDVIAQATLTIEVEKV